ncbi:NAD(P)-dependent oxidoreductase [Kribbella pittospori]|uniref:NAD(P)-dependent oxidoreductase n=1 Tax=Kribbella pittospori TaxID=722689 RepID=A0A4V2M6X7_9ACTN|nr:NAD(P)-dependent oxidoreductase [Kribbella pittospori]TCC45432.1 NAD(P)-dependent oxidoreductase [Kribbella pittospori]
MHVFVAGATGAIGRQLIPRLVRAGHAVTATTRTPDKVDLLHGLGAVPVVVDGLDSDGLRKAVFTAGPDVIVHQMTALAGPSDLRRFDRWFHLTNRLRTEGADTLLAAAREAGVSRFIAQSYTGWTNARTGGPVATEAAGYDPDPATMQRESLAAIKYLDEKVPLAEPAGIVLRYGNFYGPGASDSLVELIRRRRFPIVGDGAGVWSWTHIDDAAAATVAALEHGRPGVYNITDDEPARVSEWLPYLAESVGAKPPMRVPRWLGRLMAGEVAVRWMTEGRGASNNKAKHELDWRPSWPSWREGFRSGLDDSSRG